MTPEEMGDIIRSFDCYICDCNPQAGTAAEMLVDTMVGSRVYSKSVIAVQMISLLKKNVSRESATSRLANHANLCIQGNRIG